LRPSISAPRGAWPTLQRTNRHDGAVSAAQKRIVIAAGGTAGHVVPALAVADALRAEGAEVTFVGGKRAEAELVPAAGYPLHTISVEGLSRTNPGQAARALIRSARAVLRSRKLLGEIAPDAVMGGGGYVAGPVGVAALTRRIPLVLTEADSHLGLTNRVLAPLAQRVCLSFPIDGRAAPRYRVTGRPIPPLGADRQAARQRFGIAADEACVLVFGGSLGARTINQAALEAFSSGAFRVLHVCGRRDYPELSARSLPSGYDLREYLDTGEFADALAACDLAVARAGGSVFEIAAHGLPAILVPYPHASSDHQSANAHWMCQAGAAIVIGDAQLSAARLAREVARLLADPDQLAKMAGASRGLARPEAAGDIAREVLRAAER
jgi:UDP-N-acetylglucosamine--N-acetylmuramyl-(pentapeptide) pyrophosphoryl-undecaprenol N-acetylglucosamine transferase